MKKGAAFYQLTKTETAIQDYKKIIIRDKTSNAIYEGVATRDLLGVPHVGNIRLAPGNHGNYDIFIQSTSVNRKLDKNTQLLYWENFDVTYFAPTPAIKTILIPQVQVVPNSFKPISTPVVLPIKRVRDRNTIQEQVRKWLNNKLTTPVSQKHITNTKSLGEFGISKAELSFMVSDFNKQFNKNISTSNWLKVSTVGDIVKFVE